MSTTSIEASGELATRGMRLAVLIDADNARPDAIDGLLAEVAKLGVASVKRIYGDWTSTQHAKWKKSLLRYSISPVQQFAYTTGKNATDSALIIDAMDLLYTRRFEGFCLVSSDSDFTRLAQRLREEGLTVFGFGEQKTPEPFVAACDKFIYTELLRPASAAPESASASATIGSFGGAPAAPDAPKKKKAKKANKKTEEGETTAGDAEKRTSALPLPVEQILKAIEDASDETGWAPLASVGVYLNKIRPDFDPRLYGHRRLSDLVRKSSGAFELEEHGANKALYVRARPAR